MDVLIGLFAGCSLANISFLFLFIRELDGWLVMAVWFESVVNCLACVDWPIGWSLGLAVWSVLLSD